jgi:hypothetical protein
MFVCSTYNLILTPNTLYNIPKIEHWRLSLKAFEKLRFSLVTDTEINLLSTKGYIFISP